MRDYKLNTKVKVDILWTGESYVGKITDFDDTVIELKNDKEVYFIEHEVIGKINYLN